MSKKVKLNLVGLDGNVFNLMGHFRRAAHRQGWTTAEINVVIDQCKNSKSYDELLCVLMDNTEPGFTPFPNAGNTCGDDDDVI